MKPRVLVFAAVALLTACSLVNALDDVRPQPDAYDAAPAPAEAGPFDRGDAGLGEGGGGAIVLAAAEESDGAQTSVLTVLDPETGAEIAERERMVVAGIRYDGLRDLWFIFESMGTSFVPAPDEKVLLRIRSFDVTTRTWTELSKSELPALQSYDGIGVVRDRLGYVAFDESDAGALQIVTLDTSNPANPTEIQRVPVDRVPYGVIATRSTLGQGGVLSLVRQHTGECDGSVCPIQLVPLRFPASGPLTPDPPVDLGFAPRFAVPAYATFASAQRDVIVFPRATAGAPSTATLFESVLHGPFPAAAVSFQIDDSALRRAAVSECQRIAFVVGTNGDLSVHAIPLNGNGTGAPTSAPTGHSGQQVYFEPTTKTVLAPFSQGPSFDLTAFRLGGTNEAPTLAPRVAPEWAPPSDLRPILLGIREHLPAICF